MLSQHTISLRQCSCVNGVMDSDAAQGFGGAQVRYYHFDFLAAFRCIACKDVQLEMEARPRRLEDVALLRLFRLRCGSSKKAVPTASWSERRRMPP